MARSGRGRAWRSMTAYFRSAPARHRGAPSRSAPQNVGKVVERGCVRVQVSSAEVVEQTGGGASSAAFKDLVLDIEVRNQCDGRTVNFNPDQFRARDTGNGEQFTAVGPT